MAAIHTQTQPYTQPPVTFSTFTSNTPSKVYQPIPVRTENAQVQRQSQVSVQSHPTSFPQYRTPVGWESYNSPITQVGATNSITRIENAPNSLVGNIIVGRNSQSIILTSPLRESIVTVTPVRPSQF